MEDLFRRQIQQNAEEIMQLLKKMPSSEVRNNDYTASTRTFEADFINTQICALLEWVVLPELRRKYTQLPVSISRILLRVFLGTPEYSTFYFENGKTPYSQWAASHYGGFATIPQSGASCYFVDMLNRFISIGGFKLICLRVEAKSGLLLSLTELVAYATVLNTGMFCYTSLFWDEIWPYVRRCFWGRLWSGFKLINDTEDVAMAVNIIVQKLNALLDMAPTYSKSGPLCLRGCLEAVSWGVSSRRDFIFALTL